MNTYKIVILGSSGSGKTTLLASMYYRLSIQSVDTGFFLRVSPEQGYILNSRYQQMVVNRRWPEATPLREASTWDFTCMIPGKNSHVYSALQFSYLDYAGERLMYPPGHDLNIAFEDSLKDADALLGLIDGRKMLSLMQNEPTSDRSVDLDLSNMLPLMQMSQSPVHFVITKWDLLQDKYSLGEVRDRLLKLAEFQEFVRNHIRRFTVRLIPVSAVGLGFAKLQSDGFMRKVPGAHIQPFQVEVPLACVLPDQFQAQIARLKEKEAMRRGKSISSAPNLTIWDLLGTGIGNVIRTMRGFLLGKYQFEDAQLAKLIQFVELGARTKGEDIAKEVENLRFEQTSSLESVRDERTALAHIITSFLYLVSKLELDFPESNLSKFR